MKPTVYKVVLSCLTVLLAACNREASVEKDKEQLLKSYKQAHGFKDHESEQVFLISLYQLDRTQVWALDSLFYSYAASGKMESVALMAELLYEAHETDIRFVKTAAESIVQSKQPGDALVYYNKWQQLDSLDARADYGAARTLMELEQYDEAISVLSSILATENANEVLVDVSGQTVSLSLASLNLIGICELKAGRVQNGIQAFSTALEMAPNFVAAQNNLKKVSPL